MVAPAVKVPANVPLSLERCLAAGGPVPQPALHVTREPAQYRKRSACTVAFVQRENQRGGLDMSMFSLPV
jgi:hypothetical protein